MAGKEEPRLIARVARLYYESKMTQNEIADKLGLSQAAISRLLKQGERDGIIKVVVNVPRGVYTEMEEALVQKFGMKDAVIADCLTECENPEMLRTIGGAAAAYIESILRTGDVIGLSSWSTMVLATVEAMSPIPRKPDIKVVQILGGLGGGNAQSHSTYIANRLATMVSGLPYFLPLPAVVSSKEVYQSMVNDKAISNILKLFPQVTTALVGIGDMNPSSLLAASGNVLSEKDLLQLKQQGAVGDILLRFFDKNGRELNESLMTNYVISMELNQLKKTERAIGIAGGARKFQAILGALRGKLINILITDQFTAKKLLEYPGA